MYFQLNDQIQGAATDIGWQIDELKREATDRSDRSKEEAGYLAERLIALEARSEQLEATSWRAEETQRDIAAVREQLAVLQASTTEFDVERVESDLSYLKERVIWLEAQAGQPLDTQWLEEQINELRNQVADLEGVIANGRLAQVDDLFMLVDDIINRLTLLENIGNHARLLEKARGG
jgi:chromosome segregation ATPase